MKRSAVALLCGALAGVCLLCGAVSTTLQAPTAQATTQTPDDIAFVRTPNSTQPTAARRVINKALTVEQGSASVLALSKGDEAKLVRWESNDAGVVAVDDGGRIDAVEKGNAQVTAHFSDNRDYVYTVNVVSAKKQTADAHTTAVTANADAVAKNKKAAKSGTPLYAIDVNRAQNFVTVYTYDSTGAYTIPVRAMLCSCGKEGHETLTGEFTTYFKTEWHPLYNGVCGRYVTGFSGDFLFHSVPYRDFAADTLKTAEFNKLGDYASLGCVRLAVNDAKWIYDNCAVGTTVRIYDSDDLEPLGKPEAIRITDTKNGWDPTDTAKKSPYAKSAPRIEGAGDITVKHGAAFDAAANIKAFDTCGNDVTERLETVGNVVTTRAGSYRLTYRVTDALGRSAQETVTVTVT